MKKRILSCLMALALCLTLLPTAALAEGTEGTAQTPPAVEKSTDPANGEVKQESQPAEAKQENQPVEAKQESQPAEQEEQQEDSAAKQAVTEVQAMIDALPDAAELDGMDGEARESACFAASEAYEAYDALTEEQQSALTGAEKMIAILKWTTEQVALAAGPEHTNHPICGDSTCTNNAHALPDGKSWVGVSSLNEITEAGHYFLKQSVTIRSTWNPVDGVVLCLNGCDITMNGVGYAIYVREGYTFTLCDCKGGGKGGGKITHTKGVDGRGVYVVGFFNMYGGSISGNSAQWGSGVCLDNGKKGTVFNMYGGEITGNTATSSGGGGVNVNTKSTFNMYGGSITDNLNPASGDYGGGVYVSQDGIFTVSGKVNITGNKYKDNTVSNVYLYSDKTIQIVGALDSTASIGVTTKNAVDLGKFVTVATGGANSCTAGNFFADKGKPYGIKVEPDTEATGSVNVNLYNGLPHKHPICGAEHKDINGHTGACDAVNWTPWDGTSPITYNSEKTAYVYLTANAERDSALTVADGHKLYLCLNGNDIEMTSAGDVISVDDGGTLTLTDCQSTGAVRHDFSSHPGHGVVIRAGGTFSLFNAKIQYNQGSMEGRNDSAGAGVYMGGGTFHMYSGSIRENEALRNGGGVYMDGGEFTMSGGTIEENNATDSSSGIYGDGGGVYINNGTFTMTGGSITNNTALNFAGVCVATGGTFTVSGKVTVTGNRVGQTENNVYLYTGKSITIGAEGLNPEAKIGVSRATIATGESVTIATGGADSCTDGNFIADAGGAHFIKVEPDAGTSSVNVKLYNGQPPVETHKHFLCGGDVCTEVGSHHDTEKIPFTEWTDALAKSQNGNGKTAANSLPSTAGQYYLTSDVELDGSNHIPWMPKGNTVLCLNGHKITMKGDTDVISVNQGVNFFLTDCKGKGGAYGQITHAEGQTGGGVLVKAGGKFYMFGGSITGNKTRDDQTGGGVYVLGDFNLYGGEITGNKASEGGGVYAAGSSTFTMYGGSITGNKANIGNAKNGGGVYVGGSSTFTMNDGAKISGNWANYGGGVFVKESGKFTLSGGAKISGNTAQYNGGGVCMNAGVDGKFTMSGGTIGGTESGETNTAKNGGGVYAAGGTFNLYSGGITSNEASEGGGVHVDRGTFTMNGGGITGNGANYGGGVDVRVNGTFTMTGGSITGNEATQYGGGVLVNGTFNMRGGEIRSNAATEFGGGVYMGGNSTFTVSGSATVTGNKKSGGTANNVYLYSGNSITIDGTLDNGASIGVTTAGEPAEDGITIAKNAQNGDENRFVSDAGYQITYDNGTVVLKKGHTHPICGASCSHTGNHDDVSFGKALTAKENDSGTYELYANDSKVSTFNNCYDLPAGSYYLDEDITLDNSILVMGREVDLCLNGHTITMRGNDKVVFQISKGSYGNNATLNLTDCSADKRGTIQHAPGASGFGVWLMEGSFNMYGGTITGNACGVYMFYSSPKEPSQAFTMYGGSITGNQGNYGGVYFYQGTMTLNGSPVIKDNTAKGETSNVYLAEGKTITIGEGGLTGDASIGVTTEKAPDKTDPVVFAISAQEPDTNRFTSDKEGIEVQFREDGKLMLAKKDGSAGHSGPHCICGTRHGSGVGDHTVKKIISDWTGVDSLDQITSAGYYFLKQDVELDAPWTPVSGTVLCLNGFNITANGNFNAITVNNGAVFTLTDCQGLQSIAYGKITHASGTYGRGVEVEDGTFNLYKGEITGNNGEYINSEPPRGGGVMMKSDSTFNMYGGKISGNMGSLCDGGVNVAYSSSTFNLYGGEISNNNGVSGGVYVDGTFNMTGGEIKDNRATISGGVDVRGGAVFNMSGGSITNNTANYGGVYVYNGATFTVSGSANITGNKVGKTDNNVYLSTANETVIGVTGALTGTIGVTTETWPGGSGQVAIASGESAATGGTHYDMTHDDMKCFQSDNGEYQTSLENNTVLLAKMGGGTPPPTHEHTYGAWSKDATHHWHECTDDKCPDKPGSIKDKAAHVYDDDTDTICNVCGYVRTVTTEPVPVDSITLNKTSTSISVGNSEKLTATVKPENATDKTLNWASSDTSVATVAADGTVTAVKAGAATITATAADGSGKSAACTVTVTGGSTGGNTGGSSSGGGGDSSSDRDSSDSNPVIKTETKNNADGSTTKTETRRDGSVTQTTTGKDGGTSKTETKKDGSSVTENKAADGSTGTMKTDKNGQTEAAAKVSGKAVEDAKKNGEAVKAPVEVKASRDSSTAPTVKVELPKGAGETKVEISVSNVKPGTVAVLVHPDGTEEILKDSIPTEDGIQLTVDGNATVKIVDNSKGFIDTRNHWAEDAIDFVSARGLVNGMTDTIYAPNNSTTRAQLWTILARQNDADLSGGSIWYEKAQNWAKSEGVSDGANPNAAINRAQMVTMLWRAVGQPAPATAATFTDVSADAYYAGAVSWAVENGITTGVGGGKFDPTGACTRAQIAAFLARLYAGK